MEIADALVGTWAGSIGDGFMRVSYRTTLGKDLTFATDVQSYSHPMRTTGTYKIINGNTIEFTNKTKWPESVDVSRGKIDGSWVTDVHSVNITDTDSIYFRFLNNDTLVVESSIPGSPSMTCQRVTGNIPAYMPNPGVQFQGFQNWNPPNMFSEKAVGLAFLLFVIASGLYALWSAMSFR